MAYTKAARRCCNSERAKVSHPGRDADSLAREYDEWTRVAGLIIGIAFGLMLFVGILAG